MIKRSIQKDVTIVNMYTLNMEAPQYIRQILTAIKGEIDSNPIIVKTLQSHLLSFFKKNISLILRLYNPSLISSPTHLHKTPTEIGMSLQDPGGISFEVFCSQLFHPGTAFSWVAPCILWHTPPIHEFWETVWINLSPPRILTFWSSFVTRTCQ